jgi:endo-1,4-beta-xylanase
LKSHAALFRLIYAIAVLSLALIAETSNAQAGGARQSPAPATTLRQAASAKNVIIGAAAGPRHLNEPDYAAILAQQFSQLEPENQMKFGVIHPRAGSEASSYDFAPADKLVAFAEAHTMKVRGHCFVWHEQVADWVTNGVKNLEYDPAALNKILHDHINIVAKHYSGKVWAWDVVNEAFNTDGTMRSTVWYDAPGIGFAGQGTRYIEEAFRSAHSADPNAKLFYNDYDTEAINAKSDAVYAMAKDFRSRGVPLDGVGFQAHVNLKFDDPQKLDSFAANLKRFSDLGLEIHITELDVALDDDTPASLKKQGDLYGKVTEICLRNPNCRVLQTWGFTDKYSWIPSYSKGKQGWALPYDAAYRKKPAYDATFSALESK